VNDDLFDTIQPIFLVPFFVIVCVTLYAYSIQPTYTILIPFFTTAIAVILVINREFKVIIKLFSKTRLKRTRNCVFGLLWICASVALCYALIEKESELKAIDNIFFRITPYYIAAFLSVFGAWLYLKDSFYDYSQELETIQTFTAAGETEKLYGSAKWGGMSEASALLHSPDSRQGQAGKERSFAGSNVVDFLAKKGQVNFGIPCGFMDGRQLRYSGEKHAFLCAPNRSGKGVNIIVQAVQEHQWSVLVMDPKGELAAITGAAKERQGKTFYLNPYKMHQGEEWSLPCHGFNPLEELDPLSGDFVADVGRLSQALVYSESHDPYWDNSARMLVQACIMWACMSDDFEGRRHLPAVRDLIADPESLKEEILKMKTSGFQSLENKAGRFISNSKGFDTIIETANTQLEFLDDPAIRDCLARSDFQLSRIKREKMTVFLILPFKQLSLQARWLRLVVGATIDACTADTSKPRHPVLFALDEFAQLGHMEVIENALGMAAGSGVQLFPVLQDLNQLENLYEKAAQTFLAAAGVQIFLRPRDLKTARHVSDTCGTKTSVSVSRSSSESSGHSVNSGNGGLFSGTMGNNSGQSEGIATNEAARPLILPQEVMQLPKDEAIVIHSDSDSPFRVKLRPYWEALPAGSFRRNPFHVAEDGEGEQEELA